MTVREILEELQTAPPEILDTELLIYLANGGDGHYSDVTDLEPVVVKMFNGYAESIEWEARAIEGQLVLVVPA